METITEQEYHQEVVAQANLLVDDVEDSPGQDLDDALYEATYDAFDGHKWVGGYHDVDLVTLACIVHHGGEHHIDPGLYIDDDPEEAMHKLAFEVFRLDVLDMARDKAGIN